MSKLVETSGKRYGWQGAAIFPLEYFDAPASGGAVLKVWDGSDWVVKPLKYWNGSAWVLKPLKMWLNGSWITTT